ncbi:PRTRC system ParB family protein (plasmid) [Cupriavidus basilensis]
MSRIRPGRYNPRRHFDPAKMAELVAGVRAAGGIMQPIVVRPVEDGDYEIIAGERRYRAAKEVYGMDYDMPVVVKDVDDETAEAMAIIENVARDDMAPSEEASAAARLVGKLKGDREEAATILGWSRAVLDKRLALMNCSQDVLNALNERRIQLGHAELLAALPKGTQDKFLPVIISEKKSIAELKKTIETAACSLASAIFDKADCAACPHNSSLQTELFGESIGTGNCTNRVCFTEKTETQLATIQEGLKDEFPAVRIVRLGENFTRIQLVVEGATGVGEEQARACHACQNYGAAVSALPDALGKVYRGQCFDTGCNSRKVAARIAAEKAKTSPPETGAAAKATPGAVTKGGETPVPTEKAATVVSETDKVKNYRVALWRKCLRKEVASAPDIANQYLIAIALSGLARKIEGASMCKLYELVFPEEKCKASDLRKALDTTATLTEPQRQKLTMAMMVSAVDGIDVPDLVQLCKYQNLDLRKYWKLSKDFLELLTKSEMKVVTDEIGLLSALGNETVKVFNKPKPELIEALLNVEGFAYEGKVPRVLTF